MWKIKNAVHLTSVVDIEANEGAMATLGMEETWRWYGPNGTSRWSQPPFDLLTGWIRSPSRARVCSAASPLTFPKPAHHQPRSWSPARSHPRWLCPAPRPITPHLPSGVYLVRAVHAPRCTPSADLWCHPVGVVGRGGVTAVAGAGWGRRGRGRGFGRSLLGAGQIW